MPPNPPLISEIGQLMILGTYTTLGTPDDRYRKALHQLLPPGPALPLVEGTDLDDLLRALAPELERVDAAIWLAWLEMDPLLSTYHIERWEELTGVPGKCAAASTLLSERRKSVVAKLTAVGAGPIPSWEKLALAMGYTVTITEGWTRAARCGQARCGDARSSGLEVLFQWEVATSTGANDEQLKCIFEDLKPAHTTIYWDIT